MFLVRSAQGPRALARMVRTAPPARLAAAMVLCLTALLACDTLLTTAPEPGDDFESPFENLPQDQNALFARGDENFDRAFTVRDGLGPLFNHTSCGGCHSADGRGTSAQALIRFSQGSDPLEHLGGPQLQDKAIPGVRPEALPAGVDRSLRLPPPVFGLGLVEAISVATILALADPADGNGDSISGRPNLVSAASFVPSSEIGGGPGPQLGRFGHKANVSSLLEQVVNAYHQDIGVTSDFAPVENPNPQSGGVAAGDVVADPELSAAEVFATMVYVRLLAPPKRGELTPEVMRGEALFTQINCVGCHIPVLTTGPHALTPLDEVDVHLFSDLLLHDMGPGLADHRPDGQASGSEWRTAPLWGLRLVRDFLDGQMYLLHDGRARSLTEAIELHGGEAQPARDLFMGLPQADRDALLDFLESL